jgi:iron(III) transport system substrate-binding protein
MRKIIKGSSFKTILLSATIFVFVIFFSTSLRAADVLKVYTHADVNEMEKWAPEAEKILGIKVEWSPRFTSTELWTRVQAETPNFLADMLWGFLNAHALIGAQRGYFMPYKSPTWADIPDRFKDPDGLWYGYNYWFACIAVNSKRMAEKNLPMPKSWNDLTNPVYKGELVMPNPGTSGTAFVSVAAIMQIYGEEKGWEYLEKLDKNIAQYTQSGSAPAQMVAQGEYAVGISWDQAVYGRADQGFPIVGVIPTEGTAYDLESVAILKGCKQLKAAQKLVDWLGAKEGQTFIGTFRSKVTRPGIPSKVKIDPNLIKFDAIWAGENQKRIMEQWKARFKK